MMVVLREESQVKGRSRAGGYLCQGNASPQVVDHPAAMSLLCSQQMALARPGDVDALQHIFLHLIDYLYLSPGVFVFDCLLVFVTRCLSRLSPSKWWFGLGKSREGKQCLAGR